MTRIFVSAGEPSGDLHGAAVIRALLEKFPGASIDAFGGKEMARAGAQVLWPMERYSVLGLTEILSKIPAHARLLRAMRRTFRSGTYDLVVLIDYPGFHLRVAEVAKREGLAVLYFIAPQFWAWRPQRASRFRKAVDRFAVIFPFEETFLKSLGIPADYVGHPLLDRPPGPSRIEARRALGVSPTARVLGLFPGSRAQELRRHWVPFRDAARLLHREGAVDEVLVAGVAGAEYPGGESAPFRRAEPAEVLVAADAVIAKSGTTTLEAALADTVMVVAYRVHRLTEWIARRLIRVRWIGLVNLIANESVAEELVQEQVNPDRLATAVRPLLDPQHPVTRRQREKLAQVRAILGGPGAAGRVAVIAGEMIR